MSIPGPQNLIAGNMQAGFFGETPVADLIRGDTLAALVGLSAGNDQAVTEPWLKFAYKRKILFVAQKPYKSHISWDSINAANCVYGNKSVVIGELTYKIRLLTGGNGDPSTAAGGEWDALMYGVHEDTLPDWWNYTDEDLVTKRGTSYLGRGGWCQESTSATAAVRRGSSKITDYTGTVKSSESSYNAWRPVLELVQESEYPKIYVGANGVNREIVSCYIGIGGVNQKIKPVK